MIRWLAAFLAALTLLAPAIIAVRDAEQAAAYANSVRQRMGWKPLPPDLLPYCDMLDVVTCRVGGVPVAKLFIYPPLRPVTIPRVAPGEREIDVVRDIARFVSDTMTYDVCSEPSQYTPDVLERTVGQLLLTGHWRGACGTAAYLFSYLCRCYGIPTRIVLIEPSGVPTVVPGTRVAPARVMLHAQVQVWVDGRWITVDPSVGIVGDSDKPVKGSRVRPDGTVLQTPGVRRWMVESQGPVVFWTNLTALARYVLRLSEGISAS